MSVQPPHDELKPSWVKIQDMEERIAELEERNKALEDVIIVWSRVMENLRPHFWNHNGRCVQIQRRIKELGIRGNGEIQYYVKTEPLPKMDAADSRHQPE